MKFSLICLLLTLARALAFPSSSRAAFVDNLLPNPSFERGDTASNSNAPVAWSSASAEARWEKGGRTGHRAISIGPTAADGTSFWRCDHFSLEAGQLYRLSFWSRAENSSGGSLVAGLENSNVDFPFTPHWQRHQMIFSAPPAPSFLRLGQWNAQGRVWFDDVQLEPLRALHREIKASKGAQSTLRLGEGESIEGDRYHFAALFALSNASRPLIERNASFNTDRWSFNDSSALTFRHDLGTYHWKRARISTTLLYYAAGKLQIEASADGRSWTPLGEGAANGTVEAEIPTALLPAKVLWVRLRGANGANFQLNSYDFAATLDARLPDVRGHTFYWAGSGRDAALSVKLRALGDARPGGANIFQADIAANSTAAALPKLTALLTVAAPDGSTTQSVREVSFDASRAWLSVPYRLTHSGANRLQLRLQSGAKVLYSGETTLTVAGNMVNEGGHRIAGAADVWWCENGFKISRDANAPLTAQPIEIHAAGAEYEPFQIVVRPTRDLPSVAVSLTGLRGPRGAVIDAKAFEVRDVEYVRVERATDAAGATGDWPDPLPPHHKRLCPRDRNTPFWITLHVPANVPAGIYVGRVRLKAAGWQREIPLRVRVWDFTLPRRTHLRSGFGLDVAQIKRQHNLQSDAEVARVLPKYFESFASHRIAPYEPAWNAPIGVDWGLGTNDDWEGAALDSSQPFAGKTSLRIDDNRTDASVSVAPGARFPIQNGRRYRCRFEARTARAGQMFQAAISFFDAKNQWLPGHNFDLQLKGDGSWQTQEFEWSPPADGQAVAARLRLHPTVWSEDGAAQGSAWFDAIEIAELGAEATDKSAAKILLTSDFEMTARAEQVKIDFFAFDAAAKIAFETYHFNAFKLSIEGIGGGTFFQRRVGRIGPFVEGSPEYQTLFAAYLRQLRDHLALKGWLDKAYVYWFDEPDAKDYAFVRATNERIRRAAPGLKVLLTEQPEAQLNGSVDIWCAILDAYDPQRARERKAAGDEFWWYICTGPKAPYVSEFIDHEGAGQRVWLWQSWQAGIDGILIWETTYWSSDAANPNPQSPQNPWRDPMSWVAGYGTPRGAHLPWGNGDGRFFYPPNRDGNRTTKYFVAPIPSLRWEMLREGIEDYEYFWLLRDLTRQAKLRRLPPSLIAHAESLLRVPAPVSRSLTDWNHKPLPLLAHRDKVAREIERLSAQLKTKITE